MTHDQSPELFRPLSQQDINHSEHLIAAAANPEIFSMLPGHEQKVATAAALVERLYCDSKTNTFMANDQDRTDARVEASDQPHHQALVKATARKLGDRQQPGAQDQSLHDMTIEIAGDIARQATADNILYTHRNGTKINSSYDTMISYLAGKEGALEEVEQESKGNYSQLAPEAQKQAWESIKSGDDIPFDFEPLLDKTLGAIQAVSEPIMQLSDELTNNTPPNLLVAAAIIAGNDNGHPVVKRSLSVVESFVENKTVDGMADHYKLQATARAIGLVQSSETHGRKLTEEMVSRTMLSDIRIMHSANLRLRHERDNASDATRMIFRGEYADLPVPDRAKAFRTMDIGSNIAPEEKMEIAARCQHERQNERGRNFVRQQDISSQSASAGY